MIGSRDDLDLDWDVVYAEAARTGTALEMNGSPHRLDLAVERARRALETGCLALDRLGRPRHRRARHVGWGISQARRAWVSAGDRAEHAVPCRPPGAGSRGEARARADDRRVPSPER